VFDMLNKWENTPKIVRHPYWMRKGYVEELVKF